MSGTGETKKQGQAQTSEVLQTDTVDKGYVGSGISESSLVHQGSDADSAKEAKDMP